MLLAHRRWGRHRHLCSTLQTLRGPTDPGGDGGRACHVTTPHRPAARHVTTRARAPAAEHAGRRRRRAGWAFARGRWEEGGAGTARVGRPWRRWLARVPRLRNPRPAEGCRAAGPQAAALGQGLRCRRGRGLCAHLPPTRDCPLRLRGRSPWLRCARSAFGSLSHRSVEVAETGHVRLRDFTVVTLNHFSQGPASSSAGSD